MIIFREEKHKNSSDLTAIKKKKKGKKKVGGRSMRNNLEEEEREGETITSYTSFMPLPTGGSLVKQLTAPVLPLKSHKRF